MIVMLITFYEAKIEICFRVLSIACQFLLTFWLFPCMFVSCNFSFYTAAPLSLSCNCAPEAYSFVANRVSEFIVNGKNHMPPLEFHWLEYLSPLLKLGWLQWIGAVIFFFGWLHQRRCHAILVSITPCNQFFSWLEVEILLFVNKLLTALQ